MRPFAVVVRDVETKDALEVAAVEDQQPVEALRADGAHEPLGDRVRLRRPYRRPHDPDPFAAKEFIEGPAVLGVAIADQEADALVGQVEAEIARLLRDPGAGGLVVQPASQTRRLP